MGGIQRIASGAARTIYTALKPAQTLGKLSAAQQGKGIPAGGVKWTLTPFAKSLYTLCTMLRIRRALLLATLLACASLPARLRAQVVAPGARDSAVSARQLRPPPVSTAGAPARAAVRDTAPQAKSLPQRVFDAPWVLFPTRLAIVIVLLAVSLLMSGCWGAARFAHLLRHMQWKEPPRQLKRGEVGAAGASLVFEFDERLHARREEDEERDRQLAWLRTSVLRLTAMQRDLAGTLEAMRSPEGKGHPYGTADDIG